MAEKLWRQKGKAWATDYPSTVRQQTEVNAGLLLASLFYFSGELHL